MVDNAWKNVKVCYAYFVNGDQQPPQGIFNVGVEFCSGSFWYRKPIIADDKGRRRGIFDELATALTLTLDIKRQHRRLLKKGKKIKEYYGGNTGSVASKLWIPLLVKVFFRIKFSRIYNMLVFNQNCHCQGDLFPAVALNAPPSFSGWLSYWVEGEDKPAFAITWG